MLPDRLDLVSDFLFRDLVAPLNTEKAADRLSERPAAHLQYIRLSYSIVDNFWSTILRKVTEIDQKELKLICFNSA